MMYFWCVIFMMGRLIAKSFYTVSPWGSLFLMPKVYNLFYHLIDLDILSSSEQKLPQKGWKQKQETEIETKKFPKFDPNSHHQRGGVAVWGNFGANFVSTCFSFQLLWGMNPRECVSLRIHVWVITFGTKNLYIWMISKLWLVDYMY